MLNRAFMLPGAIAASEAAAGQAAADLPFQQEPVLTAGDILQVAAGLGIALLAAVALMLMLRRWYGPERGNSPVLWRWGKTTSLGRLGARRVEVREARRVTRRTTVAVISVDGEELLLAEHSHAVVLHRLQQQKNDRTDSDRSS
jgi:flagellar biogenesis protein FliO